MPDLFEQAHRFVKPLMDGLPREKRDALVSIAARRGSPPPTGEQLKIHIFHHVRGLAEKAGLPHDPLVISEAICRGDLHLE